MSERTLIVVAFLLAGGARYAKAQDAAAPAPPASLLANGDFETDANGDGLPDGWLKENTTNISCVAEGTNHFLRLRSTTPGKTVLVYREVPLTPEHKALELGFRVRYEGIQAGAEVWFDGRIMMNFKDAAGKVVKPGPPPPFFRGTKPEWQLRRQTFLVPDGAVKLEVMPALFQAAAGTLDFDDFRLTPVDPAAVKADAAQRAAERVAAARAKVHREPGAPLLENGDFESLRDGLPVGWLKQNDANTRCETEGTNHYLRLHSTDPGQSVMLYRSIPLGLTDKAVELSFRVRYEDIKMGTQLWHDGRIMMNFVGPDKQKLAGAPAPYFRGTAKEWRQKSMKFLVPDGAVALEFMPTLFMAKRGTLDLDDIRLMALSEAEAQAMVAEKAEAARQMAERAAILEKDLALPPITPELKVAGNKLVTADGKPVWLQGLSVDSMQWGPGESILWSIRVAINEWHANVIRLALKEEYWFGEEKAAVAYRASVDQAVKLCAGKGAWLVLDLHRFGAPKPAHVEFWKDAAARYANNPAVWYELFNEPHGISWEIWRNGGSLASPKNKNTDVNPTETAEKTAGDVSTGMQAMLDAVRATGASNVVAVGGLDWSYDLSGVVKGYALDDRGGNGIVYVSHIYPWKLDWQGKVLVAAEKYPIIVTEVGCPPDYSGFQFIVPEGRHPLEGWAEDVIGLIQKHKLNWTAFSFHPRCGPMVISDWNYTPTPYWGVYVKDALAGKAFEMKKMR